MKAVREFDRFAASYTKSNIIQRQAAEYLVSWIEKRDYSKILDLGCGAGELYLQLRSRGIGFEDFCGMDLSEEMLRRHPKDRRIRCRLGDFSDPVLLEELSAESWDLLLSASALQWSADLDRTLQGLSRIRAPGYYALFTAGTFRTLHRTAELNSPIPNFDDACRIFERYYDVRRMERVEYRLHFESTREIFVYIKKSGVSGGRARLSYRETKRLMREYPLDYLEFELLFFSGSPKTAFSRS